jgi:hypothetical protein
LAVKRPTLGKIQLKSANSISPFFELSPRKMHGAVFCRRKNSQDNELCKNTRKQLSQNVPIGGGTDPLKNSLPNMAKIRHFRIHFSRSSDLSFWPLSKTKCGVSYYSGGDFRRHGLRKKVSRVITYDIFFKSPFAQRQNHCRIFWMNGVLGEHNQIVPPAVRAVTAQRAVPTTA